MPRNSKKNAGVMRASNYKSTWRYNIRRYWPLYLMVLPGVIFLIVFKYIPMFGCVIAFQDYSVFKGILKSDWVGLKHFKTLFAYYDFHKILKNTIILGLSGTILMFPVPLILSLMLNEVKSYRLKKTIQTSIYIPHFLSWVIVGGLVFDLFGINGLFNKVRELLGMSKILVMQKESWYRPIYILSSMWKEAGWGTVVYLATMSGIDPSLYESAQMDGASRFQRMRYITLPLLLPTALTLFLLSIGSFLEQGFEQSYNLMTPMTYSVADIFDTYVYRIGIQMGRYSFTTAIGIFQSVVGLILVVTFNKLANRFTTDGGLW